jgi:D-alanyl-lipoteichoic acid acyltransferase DltB (MBOAT superfamily)
MEETSAFSGYLTSMNFTDFGFWPRFLICLAFVWIIKGAASWRGKALPSEFDRYALATLSLYLLSCVGPLTFSIFLLLASLAYLGIYLISYIPVSRRWLFLACYIPVVLLPLIYFKYRSFLAEQVLGWSKDTFDAILIPAGISFYTFQKIAILVDAARLPKYRPRLLDFVNFAGFFPQVVAGPIERKDELMPQMEQFRFTWKRENLDGAAPWLALGFFYKICLADNLSPFINRDDMASAWPILFTTFLFGLKIYFDFCGYSLIAFGLARLLGVTLTLNFRSPYLCSNIRDFWRRWHVSLSYWFRDYVYIPMGGSRTRYWWAGLLLVFILSGIWHGAGWCFLLWGALHGIYCVVSHVTKDRIRLPLPIGWALTMILVFAAWLPFYETRFDVLSHKLAILSSPSSYSFLLLRQFASSFDSWHYLPLTVLFILTLLTFLAEATSSRKKVFYGYANHPVAIVILITLTVWFGSTKGNDFIYFSF